MKLQDQVDTICGTLKICDDRYVEIETKRQLKLTQYQHVKRYLETIGAKHERSAFFFDQYIDTPDLEICRKGASLRIRYKQDGTKVYLQYKGPGFIKEGVLFRSEFNSGKLHDVVLEEDSSHMVHFDEKSVRKIIMNHVPDEMGYAMKRQLGQIILSRISMGHLICFYHKEKFILKSGKVILEPSLDKVYSFYVAHKRMHLMSTFCEYENEIKAKDNSLEEKLKNMPLLRRFNRKVLSKFDLPLEKKDKYHRCMSLFL